MDTAQNIENPFELNQFFQSEFEEHLRVTEETREKLLEPFTQWVNVCVECIRSGGKLLFFGNGGSAGDSQHLATELTVRYKNDRPAIPAIALTTDTSALTAIGNDFGFDHLFERQVEALGRPGDIAIGITTSGKSPNVIRAMKKAQLMGIKTVGLTGKDGGDLPPVADMLLVVPSHTTARIQEMHITLGQMLCGALEQQLGYTHG